MLVEVFVQPCFTPFFRVIESIKIKVIQNIRRNYINFNKSVGRALYRAFMAQGLQQSAGEGGFAGAQVAVQVNSHARHQKWRQGRAQCKGAGFTVQRDCMIVR